MTQLYKLAVLKNGEIIATKNVRLDEQMDQKSQEFSWAMKGKELCRDALHHEGNWPPKTA